MEQEHFVLKRFEARKMSSAASVLKSSEDTSSTSASSSYKLHLPLSGSYLLFRSGSYGRFRSSESEDDERESDSSGSDWDTTSVSSSAASTGPDDVDHVTMMRRTQVKQFEWVSSKEWSGKVKKTSVYGGLLSDEIVGRVLYGMGKYYGIMKQRVQKPLTSLSAEYGIIYTTARQIAMKESVYSNVIARELQRMQLSDPHVRMDIRRCDNQKYPQTIDELHEFQKIAHIHDLIDPNRGLDADPYDSSSEGTLWIPTAFKLKPESKEVVLASPEVVNLDVTRYPLLRDAICELLTATLPLFEDVLRFPIREQCEMIECVVKAQDYCLPAGGMCYMGKLHREGVGEQIVAVAIHYPRIDAHCQGGELNLMCLDSKYGQHTVKTTIREGDTIVFSNEMYHQLSAIKNTGDSEAHRTIIAFFLTHPLLMQTEYVPSNGRGDGWRHANQYYRALAAGNVWLRECFAGIDLDFSWCVTLIVQYCAGDDRAIHGRRRRFRMSRSSKGVHIPGPARRFHAGRRPYRRHACNLD